MSNYTLYGSQMSYFTGKARAYMDWKSVPYSEVAPTPDVMKNEIIANVGWPVIPVLKTPDGTIVQDTADIIETLEAVFPEPPVLPNGPLQRLVTYLLQLFADEWLTIPAMHYRWNHNEDWIYGEFGKSAAPGASPEQQYEAGKAVGQRFRGFVPTLGVSEATIPGIEASYEAFLAEFSAHLDQYPYLFGGRASYADFAFYGPLYAHQYRDVKSGELMKAIAPKVADWVERLMQGAPTFGPLLDDDQVPDTLLPILKRQMREQLPVLLQTNDLLADWLAGAEPHSVLPRGLDPVAFTTGGHSGTCVARTFPLWRLQAALDARDGLPASKRQAANDLFDEIGAPALKGLVLAARLTRRNYRLALE